MKSRLFRFGDRSSYKTSEVLALFLLSLFLGMIFFLVCLLLMQAIDQARSWLF